MGCAPWLLLMSNVLSTFDGQRDESGGTGAAPCQLDSRAARGQSPATSRMASKQPGLWEGLVPSEPREAAREHQEVATGLLWRGRCPRRAAVWPVPDMRKTVPEAAIRPRPRDWEVPWVALSPMQRRPAIRRGVDVHEGCIGLSGANIWRLGVVWVVTRYALRRAALLPVTPESGPWGYNGQPTVSHVSFAVSSARRTAIPSMQ